MQLLDTMVARAIPWVPRALIHKISRRYIAGDNLTDALVRVRQLNAQGFTVTLDLLGETISTLPQAQATADTYMEVLHAVHDQGLQANISIKPSAFGLLLEAQQCEQLIARVLDTAERHRNSVCLDMEDASCTQREIDLFMRLRARFGNVGRGGLVAQHGVGVELAVGRGVLDGDLVQAHVEFLGEQGGLPGVGALAHLDGRHHQLDAAVRAHAHEGVGFERRMAGVDPAVTETILPPLIVTVPLAISPCGPMV